jgi:hypothetical protein
MHEDPVAIPITSRRHGPCQQCGWTQSLRRLTMRQFVELRRLRPHLLAARWICDDCFAIAGLAEKSANSMVTAPVALFLVPPPRHRSVA